MKFFGWMQNVFNGKSQVSTKTMATPPIHDVRQETREEFSDWPQGLLAIGTFGNSDINQNHQEIQEAEMEQSCVFNEDSASPSDNLHDFTLEEIGKLQKALTKLLSKKPPMSLDKENDIANLPLDKFLNCPSSLDISRRMSNSVVEEKEDIERTISIILGRCKDICESKRKSVVRKSISFLIKKLFVCGSGFAPQSSLRDTFQESRMEKLLRTLLHKKINPQNSPRVSSMKKHLEDKQLSKEKEEDDRPKTGDGSKWVKTDSEYIVLEI